MHCPSCGKGYVEETKFCTGCGNKLKDLVANLSGEESEVSLEERAALSEKDITTYTPHESNRNGATSSPDNGEVLYETGDVRKKEYKQLLRDVFADGLVTTDEVIRISRKRQELGLDVNEAQNIQSDVAKELGLDIHQEEDLASVMLALEINTNKAYFVDEMDDLEIRITNISDDPLEKMTVSSSLMNLRTTEERSIGTLKPEKPKTLYMPFTHSRRGNEVVEFCLICSDSMGNPSVYRTDFHVRVLGRDEEKSGSKSISISIAAEKIMGNDFSSMAEIFEKEKNQAVERISSYTEVGKQWRRLPVSFDEDETNSRREKLFISRKFKEGEEKYREGTHLKTTAEKKGTPDAIGVYTNALLVFKEAKECFKKIGEIDQDHEEALGRIKELRPLIAEIESKMGSMVPEPEVPSIRLTSACLTINSLSKKMYLYSKDRITLGRGSSNDMVLRIIPYQPQEQYRDNWEKSARISGKQGDIINQTGRFYIRDAKTEQEGSTNGIFIDDRRIKPLEYYPLENDMRINIAKVLELECQFFGNAKADNDGARTISACVTVYGETTDSCFGIDRKSPVDAIKLKRRNNYSDGEEYLILVREITLGRSRANGLQIEGSKVSDIHARVFYRDNQYWIEDLNTKHGTWVNGEQLEPGMEVSLGQRSDIRIGEATLSFNGFS